MCMMGVSLVSGCNLDIAAEYELYTATASHLYVP